MAEATMEVKSPQEQTLAVLQEKLAARLTPEQSKRLESITFKQLLDRQEKQTPPPAHEKGHLVSEPMEDGVSGDYWDARATEQGTFLITIEDHRNHGIEGALYREAAHANEAVAAAQTPAEYIKALHDTMVENLNGAITAPAAAFEIKKDSQEIAYTGQGTPLILVNLEKGTVDFTNVANAGPVGMGLNPFMKGEKKPGESSVHYNEGDIMLTGTDSIWEWLQDEEGSSSEAYKQLPGYIEKKIQEGSITSMQDLVDKIKEDITSSGRLDDDLTLIGVQL